MLGPLIPDVLFMMDQTFSGSQMLSEGVVAYMVLFL